MLTLNRLLFETLSISPAIVLLSSSTSEMNAYLYQAMEVFSKPTRIPGPRRSKSGQEWLVGDNQKHIKGV